MTSQEKLEAVRAKIVESVPERKRYIYNKEYKLKNKDKIKLQSKRYYEKNKDKINEKHRLYAKNGGNLKRYNITLDDYNFLFNNQKGRCAICKEEETSKINGKVKKLSVDHCHKTGKVRGLLCNSCNRGLGYFRDNKKFINNCLKYIELYEN